MLRVTIEHDGDCENPLTANDGQWTHYSFNSRHISFRNPDQFVDDETGELQADLQAKLESGLAFWLDYYEHGDGAWSVAGTGMQCPWDTARHGGLLVWEHDPGDMGAKTYADRQKDAECCLREYNDWCNGNCYWYSIHRIATCEHCGSVSEEEMVDSCGGYIGYDYMLSEIRSALTEWPDEEIEVAGDSKWIADSEDLRAAVTA